MQTVIAGEAKLKKRSGFTRRREEDRKARRERTLGAFTSSFAPSREKIWALARR